jgi:plastocyanin
VRRTLIVLTIAGAVLATVPAQAGPRRSVQVLDNYYLPDKLTLKRKTTVTWKWPDGGGDVHDVKLKTAPRGVKKWQSDPGSTSYVYKRVFTKPGKYFIVCTLHEEMTMRITVRK